MAIPIEAALAARWTDSVLLCTKCMKRQHRKDLRSDLKRSLKQAGRKDVRVITAGCLGVCPKRGVTLALGSELAATPPRLHVLENAHATGDLATWVLAREKVTRTA